MNTAPLLPQNDPDAELRKEQLAATRALIAWTQDYLEPLALVALDEGDKLSARQRLLWIKAGIIKPHDDLGLRYAALRAKASGQTLANDLLIVKDSKASSITSLDQYAQLFKSLPRPFFVETFSQDSEFAYQRLGGVNPLSLRRIDAVPAHFAVTDERLQGLLGPGETLAGEASAGRLFLCDYAILDGLPSTTDESGTRSVIPALALFHIDTSGPREPALVPLAIQLGLDPEASAVYTPKDGKAWTMAKICVQCADASYHEMGPHLLGAHFMQETFCAAFLRQLAQNHPIYKLLFPHFYELLLNNIFGRQVLVNPGGAVDLLMGGTVQTSLTILQRAYTGDPARGVLPWSFEEWDLPRSLAARGVTEIPDYPFRDDGLLVWGAIARFVAAYVGTYYGGDEDVQRDDEIQSWARDLAAPDGGHVRDMPAAIGGIDALVTILTRLIFACGPFHAAVNYPQYDAMAFIPNMPLALYMTPPADARALGDQALSDFIMKLLPPPDKAALQLDTIGALTAFRFGALGQYCRGDFDDPPALAAIEAFQRDLASVEATIEQRNRDRQLRGLRPYPYLLPSLIPPSTSM